MRIARAIAFYLPQFHPIPENDAWWGNGFTEWTNTAKAKSLFKGHYQPHVPSDLGFYDLRLPEARLAQAEMAAKYGIEGFCYYHYWFGGRRILERPFDEVLVSGAPNFPFCLCWANETWSGVWHGLEKQILIEQTYPQGDHEAHFAHLLRAFRDPRYIRIAGKPLFVIYRPRHIPDLKQTLQQWRSMAKAAGLPGLHLVANWTNAPIDFREFGFDATMQGPDIKQKQWIKGWSDPAGRLKQFIRNKLGHPHRYRMADFVQQYPPAALPWPTYPCVIHAWDNTPRSGSRGVVYERSSPELFRQTLRLALEAIEGSPIDDRIIFLKSWNEWAEGNHLEPDLQDGKRYLEVVKDLIAT